VGIARSGLAGHGPVLLLPVALVLLFYDAGTRFFPTNDETRFPMLARDILAHGDWLVPHLNGAVYLNKPPLFAWLIAIASWPGGAVTQVTASLPSLIAAVGVVLVTWWMGRRLFDADTGLAAGLVVLTMHGVFLMARVPMPDMSMTLALTGAMAALVGAEFGGRPGALIAFYALTAVAFWSKGPVGVLPLAVALAYALVAYGWRGAARVVSVPGALLLAVAVAAWWLLGVEAARAAAAEGVLRQDYLAWYVPSAATSWKALYRPFAGAASVLLPWIAVAPFAIWSAARALAVEPERARARKLLLVWAAVLFVLVGLSSQQRMRYHLPLCVPVAILVAAWFSALPLRRRAALFAAVWIIVAAGLVTWHVTARRGRNAATDLSGIAREVRARPAPVYVVDVPELVFAFYLGMPVTLLDSGRSLDEYLAAVPRGYLVIPMAHWPPPTSHPAGRPLAEGTVSSHRFVVFAKE
jgi:4-amino-4-deoxy-L-arabinose transferase-like glycosyltransferase